MLEMKQYKINMECGASIVAIAYNTQQALNIATAAGWMPWDIKDIEERSRCGS